MCVCVCVCLKEREKLRQQELERQQRMDEARQQFCRSLFPPFWIPFSQFTSRFEAEVKDQMEKAIAEYQRVAENSRLEVSKTREELNQRILEHVLLFLSNSTSSLLPKLTFFLSIHRPRPPTSCVKSTSKSLMRRSRM